MKKFLLLFAVLTVTLGSARAQISSTVTTQKQAPGFSTGRDFWFAIPSNQWGAGQSANIEIYITSPSNTTAYVEANGATTPVSITSYQVSTHIVAKSLEMESSGTVENKGIHIYSNNADISVYFLSSTTETAEGTYIIPTVGWGSDYVVAAYSSLFESSGTAYDYPSECVIVAAEDNTTVEITPTCDCRNCTSGNENGNADASVVVYPAGTKIDVTLNRGQCLQLMPVLATGPDNFDLSGTVIHASSPIGVIGGSMETNIPESNPYANFVCEMIPPVRTWGEAYYAISFAQAFGSSADNNFAAYLFIASKSGQTIYRHDCATGDHVECVISNQYGIYRDALNSAQKFTSDAPFLLVSYIYTGSLGAGRPAEVAVTSREEFTDSVLFFSPAQYTNYANVIANVNDANNITFDGTKITSHNAQCIDGNYEIFTLTNISAGAHHIAGSDSGVGVYCFGDAPNNSYAWSTQALSGTFNSPDTVPPAVDTIASCYGAEILITDSGLLPDGVHQQSGLSEIVLDSEYNMTYTPDPNFITGSGAPSSSYSMSVDDISKPAILVVDVYDVAGNKTAVTSSYLPNYAVIEPPLQNLGAWISGPPNTAYDTIYNDGHTTVTINQLHLKYGNVGFSIFDSIGGPVDLSPLAPGLRRLIQIQFTAIQPTAALDSIIFGNACDSESVAVIGTGGANDFNVTSQTWLNETLPYPSPAQAPPIGGYVKTVLINSLSKNPITIDSEWWFDTHFVALPGQLPLTVPAGKAVPFHIAYFPDSASQYAADRTQGSWFSPQVLESGIESPRFDSLIGNAVPPLGVQRNNPSLDATILPAQDGRSLEIIHPTTLTAPANFELVNVLGQSVLRVTIGAVSIQTLDVSVLPRGVYFYRLIMGTSETAGKIILGQ